MTRAYFACLLQCFNSTFLLPLAIMLVPVVLGTGSAQAQTYTESVLYSFTGLLDGANPYAGLVQDAQGNLYGTTYQGGYPCSGYDNYGCGTVFKVDTTGKETVLYSFTGTQGDAALPSAGLVQDAEGNLYGTTQYGGVSAAGAVFKVDTNGQETVLHSFYSSPEDGDGLRPYAGLVGDARGNLYGTTYMGGDTACYEAGNPGCGTVFKVDTTGHETVLYTFTGAEGDGANPHGSLVRDAKGNLYGTTYLGGDSNAYACMDGDSRGCGTVFKLDTTGNETLLYTFTGGVDGGYPYAGLVRDAKGNLYGTTSGGGAYGQGTVFKVDANGKETVLYSFAGGEDGSGPYGGLVRDAKGNLYGTTSGDNSSGGTVFKVDTNGNETVLYSFTGMGGDGYDPLSSLVRDAKGSLYGTTAEGGASYVGTVFKLTPVSGTTTALSSSPNPSSYGEAVTFTAVVTSSIGSPVDGEMVTFESGIQLIGTGKLSGGTATFMTSALTVGTKSFKAVYGGDSQLAGSTSNVVKQVVKKAE
jgi:uncharacterized repeat protein (TIGR03803 family)